MMTKAQRKRRAAIGALALLQWRDQMTKKTACRYLEAHVAHIVAWREHVWMCQAYGVANRDAAEREAMVRYETFIAEMRAQADKPRAASRAPCKLTVAMVRGDGAAGVLS